MGRKPLWILAGIAAIVLVFELVGARSVPTESSPTAPAVPDLTATPASPPVDDAPPNSESDLASFWTGQAASGADELERFSTLEEMALSADAVVIVQIVGMVDGPVAPDLPDGDLGGQLTAYRTLVTTGLSGAREGATLLAHNVGMTPVEDGADIGPTIMFLRKGATEVERFGAIIPEWSKGWFESTFRPVSSQGVYIAVADELLAPLSLDEDEGELIDPIAREWNGRSPQEMIDGLGALLA